MAVATAAAPRDEMAEGEVRREVQAKFSFLAWTAAVWVGIFVLLIAFFSFIKLDFGFIIKWLPFIMAGIPMTLFVSVASIALAVLAPATDFAKAVPSTSKYPRLSPAMEPT